MVQLAMDSTLQRPGRFIAGLIFILFFLLAQTVLAATERSVLQPGDIIFLSLPGESQLNQNIQLDINGKISLPEVGEIDVAGLSIEQAQVLIKQQLAKLYRDLDKFQLTLKEHRILISVLGFVKQPGQLDLPANGNVQMALQKANGLVPGAQLDKMQLRRGAEVITFNYKAYLDKGDPASLPELQTKDILFVPASPLIGNVQIDFDAATLSAGGDAAEDRNALRIFGEVNKPGSFSYKQGASVIDALMRAGGVTRYAAVEQVRVINDNEPVIFNLKAYLDSGDKSKLPLLKPGATIFVPIQEEEIKAGARIVYVMGEVAKPGAFEGKAGTNLLDILANAGGPTRFAESRQIRILRNNGTVIPFDLIAYTEGANRSLPDINPGDAIFVPEKMSTEMNSWLKVPPTRAIYMMGQVYHPGRFEWSDEMSLLDLVANAGGPTAEADIAHVQIISNEAGKQSKPILFDLEKFLREGGQFSSLPKLTAGSTVMIPELPKDPSDNKAQWVRQPAENSIYIMGQVGAPGRYMFNSSLNFLDILAAADGPNANADIHNIRVSHRNGSTPQVTHLNLAQYFETGDESLLPKVLPGDTIYIPEKNRNWLEESKETTVRVLGAVNKPGRYRFNDEMTVLDLLAEAGGTREDAYLKKIIVLSGNEDAQSKSFDLDSFMRKPDFNKLPLIRPGDALFIPSSTSSDWGVFMSGVRDSLSILSIFAILSRL